MSNISIDAQARVDEGKGASRRLRHAGRTPAIVYGSGEPASVSLQHKDLWKAQENEAFYSSVITMNIDGQETNVIVKDLQRHPAKALIMHVDFQRVNDKTEIIVNVPLHFLNEKTCPGVKVQGGIVQHIQTLLKVRCVATKLPEYIEVDLANANAGDIIHISDLKLPEGCESVDLIHGEDHDLAVAQVLAAKGIKEDDADEDQAAAAEEGDTEE